ncbi:MAG: hypothetical protein PVH61_00025 [Candidatus Aminicenantes bacterium]|jgi:hypothetical protein
MQVIVYYVEDDCNRIEKAKEHLEKKSLSGIANSEIELITLTVRDDNEYRNAYMRLKDAPSHSFLILDLALIPEASVPIDIAREAKKFGSQKERYGNSYSGFIMGEIFLGFDNDRKCIISSGTAKGIADFTEKFGKDRVSTTEGLCFDRDECEKCAAKIIKWLSEKYLHPVDFLRAIVQHDFKKEIANTIKARFPNLHYINKEDALTKLIHQGFKSIGCKRKNGSTQQNTLQLSFIPALIGILLSKNNAKIVIDVEQYIATFGPTDKTLLLKDNLNNAINSWNDKYDIPKLMFDFFQEISKDQTSMTKEPPLSLKNTVAVVDCGDWHGIRISFVTNLPQKDNSLPHSVLWHLVCDSIIEPHEGKHITSESLAKCILIGGWGFEYTGTKLIPQFSYNVDKETNTLIKFTDSSLDFLIRKES